jgi:beta-galactosidase
MPASLPPAPSYPFGTAYYPDHWPEKEWDRDLGLIRDAGLTYVRFGEFSWSWYEPEPGRFDWKPFDRFVSLVEKHQLRLVLCTPTATPPPWYDRLFPDGRLRNAHQQPCLSHRHFWCWNHRASRARAAQTIRTLANHYRDCPVLWGWQIDNEPNYAETLHTHGHEWLDFHPESRRDFIIWLKQRYHDSLDELNRAWWSPFWSQAYGTWEDVLIHRGFTNPHYTLDFCRWREANIADFVQWQATILREESAPGVKIGCNIPETDVPISVHIGQDYFAQAAGLDWVGTDLYTATGNRKKDLEKLAYSTDLMRSAAGPAEFILTETQGGPHERCWPQSFAGEGFGPDYLRHCAETYARHGAASVWWFLWRPTLGGFEIGMNGVQDLHGLNSERTDLVKNLASQPDRMLALRKKWTTRPRALVHYSRDSLRFHALRRDLLDRIETSLVGWHALLEAAGYQIDFVPDHELPDLAPSGTDPLVLPFSPLLADRAVRTLAIYKGPVLAGPHTGFLNEHGHIVPGRWNEALGTAWNATPGLWRDTGKLPTFKGLPPIYGWADWTAGPGTRTLARLSNSSPLLLRHQNRSVTTVDLGEWWSRTPVSGRKRLVAWIHDLLKPAPTRKKG